MATDYKKVFLPYQLKTGDVLKNRIIYPNAQQSFMVGPETWPTEAMIDDLADFCFHQDFCMEMDIPECISIQRYDSISGEELNPYRRLSAGDIQTIVGGRQRYRAIIHQRIPIHAVGVEILPTYYEDFLKKQYPDLYFEVPPKS